MSKYTKKPNAKRRFYFEYVGNEHETLVQGTFYTYWHLEEHTGIGVDTLRSRMRTDHRDNNREVKVITDYAIRPLQTKPFDGQNGSTKEQKELSALIPRCETESEVMSAAWLKKPLRSRA